MGVGRGTGHALGSRPPRLGIHPWRQGPCGSCRRGGSEIFLFCVSVPGRFPNLLFDTDRRPRVLLCGTMAILLLLG